MMMWIISRVRICTRILRITAAVVGSTHEGSSKMFKISIVHTTLLLYSYILEYYGDNNNYY